MNKGDKIKATMKLSQSNGLHIGRPYGAKSARRIEIEADVLRMYADGIGEFELVRRFTVSRKMIQAILKSATPSV